MSSKRGVACFACGFASPMSGKGSI
jgi:hypothetical protein